ncbi:hypothetical protein HNP33_002038 [Comamonas odontotermitis]|uniref:Uncharacterized protein n=1 Tax=Comamonas odontotermitis TaxID=379895 RepID=A0ABR6RFN2_9BURK|nr:hypothetical protein [Comamonas odontotermitis]MBB6577970.1 hypothetical protein [Comamonas odontotermitis]
MEAIIAHPAKGAKRSPARKTAAKPQLQDEAAQLQASALQILGFMCSELAETGLDDIPGAALAAYEANSVVFVLRNPDEIDEPIGVLVALEQLHQHLDRTALCLEAATGLDLPVAVHAFGLVDHIDQFSKRLHAALSGLPAILEDLRALTTFAGAKPFRDRPTPPIRRVERSDDELKDTPVHEAGRTGKVLALQCTWDVGVVAEEIVKLGDWLEDYNPATLEGLLRCYGLRIQALNGKLMAYLDGDGTTAGDVHRELFKGSRPFRGEEE